MTLGDGTGLVNQEGGLQLLPTDGPSWVVGSSPGVSWLSWYLMANDESLLRTTSQALLPPEGEQVEGSYGLAYVCLAPV